MNMPMNFLRIAYDVDIWVLYTSRGDMLAKHGDLDSLFKCAVYYARESQAALKILDINSGKDKIYTYEQYQSIKL